MENWNNIHILNIVFTIVKRLPLYMYSLQQEFLMF